MTKKRNFASLALTLALGGCGAGSTGTSTTATAPLLSPSDAQVHTRAVEFEQDYEGIWHVSQDTAQCVQAATNAVASDYALEQALKVNPHKTPLGDCTH